MTKTLALISLQYASAGNNPGVPIVFLIGGLSLFFGGLTKINRDRLIANMPTSKIRSVAMGLVEIYGKVSKYKDTLTAPLSGKECVYCRLSITEWKRGRKLFALKSCVFCCLNYSEYFHIKNILNIA